MKPYVNNKKEIKRAKYKYSWYKGFIEKLKNGKAKDFKNEKTIHLS